MPIATLNWLSMRTPAMLLDLQATPITSSASSYTLVKKTRITSDFPTNRHILTNWPAKSVVKVKGTKTPTSLLENRLELWTKSTRVYADAAASDFTDLLAGLIGAGPAVFMSVMWDSGNDEAYNSAEFAVNRHYTADTNGDGVDEDYYEIYRWGSTWVTGGGYSLTSSYDPAATSEETYGVDGVGHVNNGSWDPGYGEISVYAKFTMPIDAADFLDDYGDTNIDTYPAYFCARHPDDTGHDIKSMFTIGSGSDPVPNGRIYSYTNESGLQAVGRMDRITTECKWLLNVDSKSCGPCWYKDKVLTLELTYKKKRLVRTVSGSTELHSYIDSSASWSTHSTVTQTLTLPEGLTADTQVGSTFSVPVEDGYVVVLDDIKLVSIT